MTKQINDHEVFWLARYAHNTIQPLVAEAREYEPSIVWGIHLGFAHEDGPHHKFNQIIIDIHWKRTGMLHYSLMLTDKAGVDAVGEVIKEFIAKEQKEIAVIRASREAAAQRQTDADYADYLNDITEQNIAGGN